MRWPWERVPWGRGRGADASGTAAGDAVGPSPGSADPPSAEPFRAAPTGAPAAWTRLPALQRSVADTTAVAPPAAFRSSLTTHQNPSFLAPLGHLVDPDGPGGVVGGLASSVGGPIPYQGMDELRVPDRPETRPAPAVQRRIATLRPDHPVTQNPGDAPVATETGTIETGTIETGTIETGTTETGTRETPTVEAADSPDRLPEVPEVPEVPDQPPLVVARLAESGQPTRASQPDPGDSGSEDRAGQTATLGTVATAASPAPGTPAAQEATSAPAAASPALTVPVQRSTNPPASGSALRGATGRVGDGTPAPTLRPMSPTPTEAVRPEPAATAVRPEPLITPPAADGELVVARSAVAPADQQPHRSTGDEGTAADVPEQTSAEPPADVAVTGLLASGPPLVESSPTDVHEQRPTAAADGGTAPLTVVGGPNPSPVSGPAVQRQFAEPASTRGSPPDGATGSVGSSGPGLDELGYPPLIAHSVQRSAVDAAQTGRAGTPVDAAPRADPDTSSPAREAPLSGFSAAISALRDSPFDARSGSDVAEPVVSHAASQEPSLVVARRVAPDETGQLPAPGVRLQRAVQAERQSAPQPAPRPVLVQRSLIAGTTPHAAPPATGSAAASASTPAVQRLRYEDVAGPTETQLVAEPVGSVAEGIIVAESGDTAPAMPPAPASAAWSPLTSVTPAGSGNAGWSSVAGGGSAAPRSSTPLAAVQRTAAATSALVAGPSGYPRVGEPAAPMVSPAPAASDRPLLIQRRLDAPTPGTAVAPPVSPDQPTMAVSSRTVGLAEMFALAAAQPSDGGATVQRSAETEVQPAADDPPAPPPAGGSAAPAGPAAPAAPLSGAELEEMARRLYEPLTARLRAELWQDRERSGLLTDLRP